MNVYYRLAPGTEVVRVGEDAVLFRSDTVSVRLEGQSAIVFTELVLPLLDGRRSATDVAAEFPNLDPGELLGHLDELVRSRVLSRSSRPVPTTPDDREPWWWMLDALGAPVDQARQRLRDLRVAIFGLQGHGAHVADALARLGVGELVLVDPFPCDQLDGLLWPMTVGVAQDVTRQELVRRTLAGARPDTTIRTWDAAQVDREGVVALAEGVDFLVACFDRGFAAAQLWVNRAALAHRKPALFAELRGHRILAGPLVLPHEGACYLCWKMRSAACADDFRDVMAYEEFLDKQRDPRMHRRPAMPTAAAVAGGLLATELLKASLAVGRPVLASHVREIDLLTGESSLHSVLQRPDCPACKKKTEPGPPPPTLEALASSDSIRERISDFQDALVSRRSGIIRDLRRAPKDPSEPALPLVYRAELANHRFLEEKEQAFIVSSGKGMTDEQARVSALGEAAERYCASMWTHDLVRYERRARLDGPSLDPRRLVLYRPEQYGQVPYAPYEEDSTLGWFTARSLASGELVHVPAIAVFMAYDARFPEENLCQVTSNGLAAGPTLALAVLSATYEVLERDAFVSMWLHRMPCQRVEPTTHPDQDVVQLCSAYGRRGVSMELFRIPMDHGCHVFVAVGFADGTVDGPAVVVGLGADLEPARAARSALLEVAQVRPALRIKLRQPETRARLAELLDDPRRVETLEDHDLLYANAERRGAFDFLRESPVIDVDWNPAAPLRAAAALEVLTGELAAQGSDILYADLTTDDLRACGVHAVRAIVPDYQPIHFGERERRLGGDRLFELPRTLGLRPDRVSVEGLNPDPHPLA